MRNITFSFLLFSLFFSACKSGEKNKSHDKISDLSEIPFSVLSEGNNGGFDKDTLIFIRTNDEMKTIWKKLFSNFVDLPDMPVVNFSNQMVVVLCMGEKNNGGYSINTTKVVEKELQVAIYADYISPGESCIVAEVISYPFLVISIPKKDKLVAVSKKFVVTECN